MARKIWIVVLLAALVGVGALLLKAQEQEKEEKQQQPEPEAQPEAHEMIVGFINSVSGKLARAAEEFPEELYEFRPDEEVRTFGEILVHVARSNDLIVSRLAKRPPSDLKQFAYTGKAEAVATLNKSFADLVAAIEKNPDPKGMQAWIYAINHGSEHYGNLVVYYRLNGLVPPASR